VKHSRFPLLSLPLLLFGCSSGDVVSPPTVFDQTPPLNANAPPLNPNAPPCNGTLTPAESLPLLVRAFCAQAEKCTTAGTPVELFDEVCAIGTVCAANPAASDCEDVTLPTLPLCGAELSACLAVYLSELGCGSSTEELSIAEDPACSRVAAAIDQA